MDAIQFPNESDEYRQARNELLKAEVELRARVEAVAAQRRLLPPGGELAQDYDLTRWVDEKSADVKFSDLFGKHDELFVYNLMFGGKMAVVCPMCAAMLDSLDGQIKHIEQHVSVAIVADHPIETVMAMAAERGWCHLPIISSHGTTYGTDYFGRTESGEIPMANVFQREGGRIRHFWGTEMFAGQTEEGMNPRHVDMIWPLWNVLDMTAKGRSESWYPALQY